ncbi:arpA protein [Chaetoceros tenuissimus]|uniref:ArpA protein n=1 Tax=Chaetoceros tenuissimus TaxID=426638 RepID=A0AAD3CUU5_9STRA|nr:arpA protein [Chaetoceros tenuissimus]
MESFKGKERSIHDIIDFDHYELTSEALVDEVKKTLDETSVATLPNFLRDLAVKELVRESLKQKDNAFYTNKTHNIYLTPPSDSYSENHIFNKQIKSSKGCIQTDQIPNDSMLKTLYYDEVFQQFLEKVLGIQKLYKYADPLSSINVHFASEGQNLGWHFDNSAFAITLLLQKPDSGGFFEYVPHTRQSCLPKSDDANQEEQRMGFSRIERVLNRKETPKQLPIEPGTLVLFRGRDSLHRVTEVQGTTTRVLAVLAYNEKPGVELSEEARITFFGRTGI